MLFQIKKLRIRNPNKIIIENLNINLLLNTFEQSKDIVMQYIDILALTETKLDATFTKAQFLLNGFSEPYRLDRSRNGGAVMIYIHENVPSKLLAIHVFPLEDLFVGFNFRKCKNRYFLKHTTHHTKQIFIVLII